MKTKTQNRLILLWLVVSLIGGAFYVRNHMYGKEYPCECATVGVFASGVAELTSPIWYPIVLVGQLVTYHASLTPNTEIQ